MKLFRTFLLIAVLFQLAFADIRPSFSGNTGFGRIRESSLRRNDRAYNKVAIDLLNGKSRQVSIDRMISLLEQYNVVEFASDDMVPVKDMILREVAFRMLKDHYLPRIDDKIKVYRYANDVRNEPDIDHAHNYLVYPELKLTVGAAVIKESKQMHTLYWTDIVSQISSAVEILWINRIHRSDIISLANNDQASLFEVLGVLKSKYLLEKSVNKPTLYKEPSAKIVVEATDEVLSRWSAKGIIVDKEVPVLALLIKYYILLNIASNPAVIARQIKQLKDVNILHNVLIERIGMITQYIKVNNPSDYAVFAMLQSLMYEISDHVLSLSGNSLIASSQIRTKLEKPRYSA